MKNVDYTTVTIDGEEVRYTVFREKPYFRYRDICRLLKFQTTMTHYIQKLKLDKDGGYFLAPASPGYDQRAYFATIPVLFKIINNLTVYSTDRAQMFKDFCEKTFDIKCDWTVPDAKRCRFCGKELPQSTFGKRRRTLYCSDRCQKLAHHKLASEKWYAEKEDRTVSAVCPVCGKTFIKKTSQQKYCCRTCCNISVIQRNRERMKHPKSAFYNPREVYPEAEEPVWESTFDEVPPEVKIPIWYSAFNW